MTDSKPNVTAEEPERFLRKFPRQIEGSRMLRLWIEIDGKKREALVPPGSCLQLIRLSNEITRIDLPNGAKTFLFMSLSEAYDAIYHENKTNPINDLRSSTAVASGTVHDGDIYLGEDQDDFWFVEKANVLEQDNKSAEDRAAALSTADKYWRLPNERILTMMFNARAAGAFAGTYDDSDYYLCLFAHVHKFGQEKLHSVGYDLKQKGASRLVYAVPKI